MILPQAGVVVGRLGDAVSMCIINTCFAILLPALIAGRTAVGLIKTFPRDLANPWLHTDGVVLAHGLLQNRLGTAFIRMRGLQVGFAAKAAQSSGGSA